MEFKQEPFLKPYIERNIELQREAEEENNKIKTQNAELRNNAIFDKLIETSMNKIYVKFVTSRKKCLTCSIRPTFKREK